MSRRVTALRYATLALWLVWAWMVMTVCHELGHVAAALLGGARVADLELRPWHLPHSTFVGDRHTLVTLSSGPIIGSALPLLVACFVRRPSVTFVAWFCLLANAAYLLLGYFIDGGELDSTRMIRSGARPAVVLGAAIVALPVGYWRFRKACIELIGGQTEPVSARGLSISAAALVAVMVLQGIAGTLLRS